MNFLSAFVVELRLLMQVIHYLMIALIKDKMSLLLVQL